MPRPGPTKHQTPNTKHLADEQQIADDLRNTFRGRLAFDGVRRLNIGIIQPLSASDRAIEVVHPEYGILTVNDLVVQMAGHGIHHLKQIREALTPKAGITD